jgi:hypothetical protein
MAVSMPFSPIPTAANAAAVPLDGATWAAARPLPAVPAANPIARQSLINSHRGESRPEHYSGDNASPMIASDAVKAGLPPICSATAIVIGVVTAFGSMDNTTVCSPRAILPGPLC